MKRALVALSLFVLPFAAFEACSSSSDGTTTGGNDASSGGGGDASSSTSDSAVAPDGTQARPACPATPLTRSFRTIIGAIATTMGNTAGADSGVMNIPTTTDRDAFAQQVLTALAFDGMEMCPLPPSYGVFSIVDGNDEVRIVAEMDTTGAPKPKLFWGTYAARKQGTGTRSLVIEAPHPLADSETDTQAARVFSMGRAEWYLLAGSHRCSNGAPSGCDGTTDTCSSGTQNPYREADTAHSTKTPFFAVHAALSTMVTSPFLQLHGNTQPCPTALVSDGSGSFADAGLAAQLSNALEAKSVAVGRCGAGYPMGMCTLCANDNVEGRYTAGTADSCTMTGTMYARFIHVEQQKSLRDESDGGALVGDQPLIDAVNATFAPR
jgi:hypothetical protein